jgi:hypothetical protein
MDFKKIQTEGAGQGLFTECDENFYRLRQIEKKYNTAYYKCFNNDCKGTVKIVGDSDKARSVTPHSVSHGSQKKNYDICVLNDAIQTRNNNSALATNVIHKQETTNPE